MASKGLKVKASYVYIHSEVRSDSSSYVQHRQTDKTRQTDLDFSLDLDVLGVVGVVEVGHRPG